MEKRKPRRARLKRGNIIAIILMIGAMLALFAGVVANNALNLMNTGTTQANRQAARYASYAGLEWALAKIIHDGQAPAPFTFEMPNQNIYVMVNVGTVVPNRECLITSKAYNGNATSILEGLVGLQASAERPPLTFSRASISFTNTSLTGTSYSRDFDFQGTVTPGSAYNYAYRQDETYSNIYSDPSTGYQGESVQLASGGAFVATAPSVINGSAQGPGPGGPPDITGTISQGFGPLKTAIPTKPNIQLPVADPVSYNVLTKSPGPMPILVNRLTLCGGPNQTTPVTLSPGNYTGIDVDTQVYGQCEIRLQGGTTGTAGTPSFYQFASGINITSANIVIDTSYGNGPVVVYVGDHVNTTNCRINSDTWNEVPANFQMNVIDPTPPADQGFYTRYSYGGLDPTVPFETNMSMLGTTACMTVAGGNLTCSASGGTRLLGAIMADNVTFDNSSIEYDWNLSSTQMFQMGAWTLVGVMNCGF